MKRKLKWTENAVSNIESLIKEIEKVNPSLRDRIVSNIFDKIDSIKNFPALGRIPLNYHSALRKVKHLIDELMIHKTDLELREVIAGNFLILYGFNKEVVIILFVKHQAQEDYFFHE